MFIRGWWWKRGARRRNEGSSDERQRTKDKFHEMVYDLAASNKGWADTRWFGTNVCKTPQDLWSYQELIYQVKPDLIIETGTAFGGSAFYMAHLCDLLGKGRIITIDVRSFNPPSHPRIEHRLGSSTDPVMVESLTAEARKVQTVLVVLDSDHTKKHVLRELQVLSPLVTVGSYIIVEDSNVNGHPVYPEHGPGPYEAIQEFMKGNTSFEVDRYWEKHLLTFNPSGYLKRVK